MSKSIEIIVKIKLNDENIITLNETIILNYVLNIFYFIPNLYSYK